MWGKTNWQLSFWKGEDEARHYIHSAIVNEGISSRLESLTEITLLRQMGTRNNKGTSTPANDGRGA
jgi:hypothetical protein